MTDDQHSNAMTEVALALAMAFFSIMVLAVVSMGVGTEDAAATARRSGGGRHHDDAVGKPNQHCRVCPRELF